MSDSKPLDNDRPHFVGNWLLVRSIEGYRFLVNPSHLKMATPAKSLFTKHRECTQLYFDGHSECVDHPFDHFREAMAFLLARPEGVSHV